MFRHPGGGSLENSANGKRVGNALVMYNHVTNCNVRNNGTYYIYVQISYA